MRRDVRRSLQFTSSRIEPVILPWSRQGPPTSGGIICRTMTLLGTAVWRYGALGCAALVIVILLIPFGLFSMAPHVARLPPPPMVSLREPNLIILRKPRGRHAMLVSGVFRRDRDCIGEVLDFFNGTQTGIDIYAVVGRPGYFAKEEEIRDFELQKRRLLARPNCVAVQFQESLHPESSTLSAAMREKLPSYPYPMVGRAGKSVPNFMQQLWRWQTVWNLMERVTSGSKHQYDFVIRARPDNLIFTDSTYCCKDLDVFSQRNYTYRPQYQYPKSDQEPYWPTVETAPRPNSTLHTMYLPSAGWYGGYVDQIGWGRYDAMYYYFNVIDQVEYACTVWRVGLHPESLLRAAMLLAIWNATRDEMNTTGKVHALEIYPVDMHIGISRYGEEPPEGPHASLPPPPSTPDHPPSIG